LKNILKEVTEDINTVLNELSLELNNQTFLNILLKNVNDLMV
jgi:ABC-type uncharacterized transport system ATPase component